MFDIMVLCFLNTAVLMCKTYVVNPYDEFHPRIVSSLLFLQLCCRIAAIVSTDQVVVALGALTLMIEGVFFYDHKQRVLAFLLLSTSLLTAWWLSEC